MNYLCDDDESPTILPIIFRAQSEAEIGHKVWRTGSNLTLHVGPQWLRQYKMLSTLDFVIHLLKSFWLKSSNHPTTGEAPSGSVVNDDICKAATTGEAP